MIGAPPVLTLKRQFSRPSAAQLEAFAEVPTGLVVDALAGRGALDQGIKPLWDCRFAGPALTADCGPRDNIAVYVAAGRRARAAHRRPSGGRGDRRQRRPDREEPRHRRGGHRRPRARSRGLEQVGLPVFCRGLTPNSPFKHGPCEVGMPLSLGGAPIAAGDLLVGDRDGVTVVPQARIDEVIAALGEVRRTEAETQARIAAGATVPAWVDELIASDKTRFLD